MPRFDPKSALISGLSLCLLLRTNDAWLAALTAVVAVGSKFVLRVHGKHVFNPTNFALVLMMLATGQVWVSPGQWGSLAVFAFLLASAGGLVVNRAGRADVTWTFLACWYRPTGTGGQARCNGADTLARSVLAPYTRPMSTKLHGYPNEQRRREGQRDDSEPGL